MEHIKGTFAMTSWKEETAPGPESAAKVTVARYGQKWTGDGVEADIYSDVVMTYDEGAGASIVGFERVVGTLRDRSGSFVLQTEASFDGRELRATTAVVPGSARGDLTGLTGTGTVTAPVGESGSWTLDYELS